MAEPTMEQRVSGIRDPGFLLYYAIRCKSPTIRPLPMLMSHLAFFLVALETLLQRNRRLSEVKDEAFSRFWRFINRKSRLRPFNRTR